MNDPDLPTRWKGDPHDHLPYITVVRSSLGWDGWVTTMEVSADGLHARVMLQSPTGHAEKVIDRCRDEIGALDEWGLPPDVLCEAMTHLARHLESGIPTGVNCPIPWDHCVDLDALSGSWYPNPHEPPRQLLRLLVHPLSPDGSETIELFDRSPDSRTLTSIEGHHVIHGRRTRIAHIWWRRTDGIEQLLANARVQLLGPEQEDR